MKKIITITQYLRFYKRLYNVIFNIHGNKSTGKKWDFVQNSQYFRHS